MLVEHKYDCKEELDSFCYNWTGVFKFPYKCFKWNMPPSLTKIQSRLLAINKTSRRITMVKTDERTD